MRTVSNLSEAEQWGLMLNPPTPWILATFPQAAMGDNASVDNPQVRFRLWVSKRGRTVHVQTHDKSPSYPGKLVPLHKSRSQYWDAIQGAANLIVCSRNAGSEQHPRAEWRKEMQEWSRSTENARLVTEALPRLLNPKRGRPSRLQAPMPLSLNGGGRGAARHKRKVELVTMCARIMDILTPQLARARDGRKLAGYTKEEIADIQAQLNDIYEATTSLKRNVTRDMLAASVRVARQTPQTQDIQGDDESSDFDLPEFNV
jgi:hypothetical protein